MGCGGGYRNLFRVVDSYSHSSRGCDSNRRTHYDHYQQDDSEEKLMLIKKMYAEGIIEDEAYQNYKQRIYDRTIGFDELVAIKRNITNKNTRKTKWVETKTNPTEAYSKYKTKLKKLRESREKILKVQDKLVISIKGLENEKKRMENLAETMLKSSDAAAEKFINKKIDLEENIQNLNRRNKELKVQIDEIDRMIKELEAKELELEAVRLQEELSNMRFEDA